MNIEKISYTGPIGEVQYIDHLNIILVGNGVDILCYRKLNECNICPSIHRIFDSHSIHGIYNFGDNRIAVYGWKEISILNITEDSIVEIDHIDVLLDMVIHISHITHNDIDIMLIGYAQNYIDIFDFKSKKIIFTVRPSLVCVLFSSLIYPQSHTHIDVASGTAFGKIELWNFQLQYENSNIASSSITKNLTLVGHEGVIFRMKVSHDRSKIVSVSDDRTVRVWDTASGICLFVGWGHKCRLWDVLFVSSGVYGANEDLLITSGEDAVLKIWNWRNTSNDNSSCISTLSGHAGRSIWCIAAVRDICSDGVTSTVIVSGGNDGSLKSWPLQMHNITSSDLNNEDKNTSCAEESTMPLWPDTLLGQNKRKGATVTCKWNATGTYLTVVLVEGAVWMVDMTNRSDSDGNVNGIKLHRVGHCRMHVTAADVRYGIGDKTPLDIVCTHPDGTISALHTTIPDILNTSVVDIEDLPWTTCHVNNIKAVGVWWIDIAGNDCDSKYFCTASMGGMCGLWVVRGSSDANQPCIELLCEIVTGNGVIASCVSCVFSYCENSGIIAIGDTRGGLSTYHYTNIGTSLSCNNINFLKKLHGVEIVSGICDLPSTGFCTLGHDGTVAIFQCSIEDQQVTITLTNQLKCAPISQPDQIYISGSGDLLSIYVSGYHASDYMIWEIRKRYQILHVPAGGWKRPHHSHITFKGVNSLPSNIVFAYFAPQKTGKDTLLKFIRYSSDSISNYPIEFGFPSLGRVAYSASYLQVPPVGISQILAVGGEDGIIKLFTPSNDKTSMKYLFDCNMPYVAQIRTISNCTNKDNTKGIIIGAGGRLTYGIWEYDITNNNKSISTICELCSTFVMTYQGSLMNTSTSQSKSKTLSKSDQEHRILSSGCLAFEFQSLVRRKSMLSNEANNNMNNSNTMNESMLSVDYVTLLCDSRGIVSVVCFASVSVLQMNYNACDTNISVIEEFQATPSGSPLLSCSLSKVVLSGASYVTDLHIVALGDSSGGVTIWILSTSSTNHLSTGRYFMLSTSKLLAQYPSHSMGTNSISMKCRVREHNISSDENNTSETIEILICSGGDDQAITLSVFELSVYHHSGISQSNTDLVSFDMQCKSICRINGAAGSALKGIRLIDYSSPSINNDSKLGVVSVGYDQRLYFWSWNLHSTYSTLNENDYSSTATNDICNIPLESIRVCTAKDSCSPLTFSCGNMVTIGDVNALTCTVDHTGDTVISVAGEGFQCYSLKIANI